MFGKLYVGIVVWKICVKNKYNILGINEEEFKQTVDKIEKDNFNQIRVFRTIFSNIDLILRFHEYCWKNRQPKEGGSKDERGKTRAVVDRFFKNVEHFYEENIDKAFDKKLNNLVLRDLYGNKAVINISELYAELLQCSIEKSLSLEEIQEKNKVR